MHRHHYLKPTLALHPEGTNLQVEATVFQNSLSQCRDVNACITLACEKKLILAVLWEKSEKFLEGQVVVHGHLENTCAKEGSKKAELIQNTSPQDPVLIPQCHWLCISGHQNRRSRHLLVTPGIAHLQSAN